MQNCFEHSHYAVALHFAKFHVYLNYNCLQFEYHLQFCVALESITFSVVSSCRKLRIINVFGTQMQLKLAGILVFVSSNVQHNTRVCLTLQCSQVGLV